MEPTPDRRYGDALRRHLAPHRPGRTSADRLRAVLLTSGTAIPDELCALVHPVITVRLLATVDDPHDVAFS